MSRNQLFTLFYEAVSTVLFKMFKTNVEDSWQSIGKYETTLVHHRNILDGLKE